MRACVVICHWVGRPAKRLLRLLGQMRRVEAGCAYETFVVANGGDERPLVLPPPFSDVRVIDRVNAGYNIAAWDAGWRAAAEAGFDQFLFLQVECFLKRPGWLAEFAFRMENDPGVGLLGEAMMWDQMSWPYIRASTDRDLGAAAWPAGEAAHPLDFYQAYLRGLGVESELGTHLQSIILFSSRAVLERVGGFPHPATYREAVACEIAISRKVVAAGYRVSKVRDGPFGLIGHDQWTRRHEVVNGWRKRVAGALRRLGLKR